MYKEIKIFFIFIFLLILAYNFGSINTISTAKEIKGVGYTTLLYTGETLLIDDFWQLTDENLNNKYHNLFEYLAEIKESDPIDKIEIETKDDATKEIEGEKIYQKSLIDLSKQEILTKARKKENKNIIEPIIIENKGVHFGFLSFPKIETDHPLIKRTMAEIFLLNEDRIKEIIKKTKDESDVLIVSFHWDDDYNENQKKIIEKSTQKIFENGADIIIFYYPDTLKSIENKNNMFSYDRLETLIFKQYFLNDYIWGNTFSINFNEEKLEEIERKIIILSEEFEIKNKPKTKSIVFSCPKPKKKYENFFLLNVGQVIGLPNTTYIPENLSILSMDSSIRKNLCLTKETRDAFERMTKVAKEEGYIIKATSGFRSYETQRIIFSNGMQSNPENTLIAIAKPGHSEHQLGTTIDLTGASINFASASAYLDQTKEDIWLSNNAHLFGFIQSYPKGKEHITGYKYEPWHYRYVGIENAKKIKELNITISEFLQ